LLLFNELRYLCNKLGLKVTINHVLENIFKCAVNLINWLLFLHQHLDHFPAELVYYSLHQDVCCRFSTTTIYEVWLGKTDNIPRMHPLSEYCLSHLLTAREGQNKKFKWELLNFKMIKVHYQVVQAVFLGRSLVANND
jgi:hypothetical protein